MEGKTRVKPPSKGSSGTYTFTTSLSSSSYNVDMEIYNSYGNLIAQDYTPENPNISLYLAAGTNYYIKVKENNNSVVNYVLYFSK